MLSVLFDVVMMGVDTLIEQLKTIADWRQGRTVQYPLWLMLLMTLLGIMSGCNSLRGLADFMKRHQKEVAELFNLSKAKLPSYNTLREMGQRVDPLEVVRLFIDWAKQAYPLQSGEVISVDGKALGSTLNDCYGQQQDFVNVVSACVQSWDGVVAQAFFHNGKSSEIASVRELLQQLDAEGVWVTMDAWHCQKNSV